MQPQTGDIVVVLNGNWTLAKMIRRVTDSPTHHTGIIVEINGRLMVSEMEATGHIFSAWNGTKYLSGYPNDRTIAIMRYNGELDREKIVDWCMQNTGEYDFAALVQHVIHRYLRIWVGRRSAKAASRLTCSEWVAYTFNTFTGLYKKWWEVTPADVVGMYPDKFEIFKP